MPKKQTYKNIRQLLMMAAIVAIGFFGLLAKPQMIFAQESTFPETPQLVTCSGAACKWCDVFALLQRAFNTAEVIIFPIIVIYIIYGAVLYIIGSTSGSEESIEKARSTVTDAIIGLVLLMLTFIIVNAAIIGITGSKIENFVNLDCSVIDTSISNEGGGSITPPPVITKPATPDQTALGNITEEAARQIMKDNGIAINHDPCPKTTGRVSGCTNLAGMRDATIAGITNTNEACKAFNGGASCNLMINGGTEYAHAEGTYSHMKGYKVDFAANSALTKYIHTFKYKGVRSKDGARQYVDPAGNVYADEGNHWDVTYY